MECMHAQHSTTWHKAAPYLLVVIARLCILPHHLQHGSMLLAERRDLVRCQALC